MAQRLPEAVRLAHEFKADLLKGEEGHQFEMARRYLDVEQKLQDRIVALTDKVALMRAAGQEVNVGKLYQLDRWASLEKQMLGELSSFNGWALERIKDRQIELGRQGVANAGELMRAAGLVGSFDKLPVDAVTAMVGMAGDGAPIRELLAESYPRTADAIAQTIVDGVALGRAPEVVAQDAAGGLGIPLDRAFLVARTEEMRAYRTGSQMQYAAAGITEYRRLATLDEATCIGCLAADGEIMDNADAFDSHPACRCTSVPIVPEATMPEWQSSEDWFNQQDAATQEGIMGPGRLDAYESGAAQWSDLWTKTDDPVWGGSIVPTNVGDLPTGGGISVPAAPPAPVVSPEPTPGPTRELLDACKTKPQIVDLLRERLGVERVRGTMNAQDLRTVLAPLFDEADRAELNPLREIQGSKSGALAHVVRDKAIGWRWSAVKQFDGKYIPEPKSAAGKVRDLAERIADMEARKTRMIEKFGERSHQTFYDEQIARLTKQRETAIVEAEAMATRKAAGEVIPLLEEYERPGTAECWIKALTRIPGYEEGPLSDSWGCTTHEVGHLRWFGQLSEGQRAEFGALATDEKKAGTLAAHAPSKYSMTGPGGYPWYWELYSECYEMNRAYEMTGDERYLELIPEWTRRFFK